MIVIGALASLIVLVFFIAKLYGIRSGLRMSNKIL